MEYGSYAIGEIIAVGGMAIVYRARPRLTSDSVGWPFCLKVIRPDLLHEEAAKLAFQTEQDAILRIRSGYVVSPVDVGVANGVPYLVMPYIEGGTLQDRLNECEQLSPVQAARFGIDLCKGLASIHSHRLIHGDIKPSNIVLDSNDDDHAKLIDVGLTVRADLDSVIGHSFGSRHYMSPEQSGLVSGVKIGQLSDIYSVGVVLFEMVAGSDQLHRLNNCGSPFECLVGVHRYYREICIRCLQASPADRYQSVDALEDDLRRFLSGDSVSACRPYFLSETLPRWIRSYRVLFSIVTILLFAVLPIGTLLARSLFEQHEIELRRSGRIELSLLSAKRQLQVGDVPRATEHLETVSELSEGIVPESYSGQFKRLQLDIELATKLKAQLADAARRPAIVVGDNNPAIGDFRLDWNFPELDQQLLAIGIADILSGDPKSAAMEIQKSDISKIITDYLYYWLASAHDATTKSRLLSILVHLDPLGSKCVLLGQAGRRLAFDELLTAARADVSARPTPAAVVAAARLLTYSRQDPEVALAAIVDLDPYRTSFWLLLEYAKALARNGKYTASLVALGRAEQSSPGTALVSFRTAYVHEMLGNGEAAIDMYRQTIDRNPTFSWAYRGLTRVPLTHVIDRGRVRHLLAGTPLQKVKRKHHEAEWCIARMEQVVSGLSANAEGRQAIVVVLEQYRRDRMNREREIAIVLQLDRFVRDGSQFDPRLYQIENRSHFALFARYAFQLAGCYHNMIDLLESSNSELVRGYIDHDPYALAELYSGAASLQSFNSNGEFEESARSAEFRDSAFRYLVLAREKILHQPDAPARLRDLRRLLRSFDLSVLRSGKQLSRLPEQDRQRFSHYWDKVWEDFYANGGTRLETWVP